VPADAEGSRVEIDGQGTAHLRDTRAVQIETLVVGARVLVVGANDVAPGPVPERAGDIVLQPVVGPEQVDPARSAACGGSSPLWPTATSSALTWPPPSTARRMA
jgi:hypothetical protein